MKGSIKIQKELMKECEKLVQSCIITNGKFIIKGNENIAVDAIKF